MQNASVRCVGNLKIQPHSYAGATLLPTEMSHLLVFGKNSTELEKNYLEIVKKGDIYSSKENSFPKIAPLPRSGHICTEFSQDCFFFHGGTDKENAWRDSWVFNYHSREWFEIPLIAPLNLLVTAFLPMSGHSCCALRNGELILVFGGRKLKQTPSSVSARIDQIKTTITNEIYSLNTKTMEWGRPLVIDSIPPERENHTFTSFGQTRAILFGGKGKDGSALNDIWAYNCNFASWTQLVPRTVIRSSTASPPPPPSAPRSPFRYGHSACIVYHSLFVYGGYDETHTKTNTLYRFDLDALSWTIISIEPDPVLHSLPPPSEGASLALMESPFRGNGKRKLHSAEDGQSLKESKHSTSSSSLPSSSADSAPLVYHSTTALLFASPENSSVPAQLFSLSLPFPVRTNAPSFNLFEEPEQVVWTEKFSSDAIGKPLASMLAKSREDHSASQLLASDAEGRNLFAAGGGAGGCATGGKMAEWVPDESSPFCRKCHVRFTVTTRRHHCRNCGYVFCSDCCSKRLDFPEAGRKNEKVCDDCYDLRTKALLTSTLHPVKC